MLLKYELIGLAVLWVVWRIYKAVMDWTDRRTDPMAGSDSTKR
jgi:hypothetical protein